MTEYGFFASHAGDRVYSDDDFANYYRKLVSNGVILETAASLQVQQGTNMTLNVADGQAMIEGRWFRVTGGAAVTIPNANGAYPRIDRVVIRCDYAARMVYFAVIQGTPAPSPAASAIVRDGTFFDIALASVYVGAGVTLITTANITDTRPDESVCGFVTGLIPNVSAGWLFAQIYAIWNAFLDQLGNNDHMTIQAVDPSNSRWAHFIESGIDTDILGAF